MIAPQTKGSKGSLAKRSLILLFAPWQSKADALKKSNGGGVFLPKSAKASQL